jgi:hypothetical protein
MNIRLASDMPNYFAKALESPSFENEVFAQQHNTAMVSNNKRSSKEYEKDLSYSFGSDTVNAIIDYPSGQSGNSHINVTRFTRSTADLSEYNQPKDQFHKDNVQLSRFVFYFIFLLVNELSVYLAREVSHCIS